MPHSSTRRNFLKAGAGAAVALSSLGRSRTVGANDRLSIGLIGCGERMRGALMPSIHRYADAEKVEITALCDPWRPAREEAAAMCKKWFGKEARQYGNYRQLLDEADVDIVFIASCDHHHCTHLQAAAEAGKDAYCEKPLARTMKELLPAYDAVKNNKRIFQAGTQIRSLPSAMAARTFYKTGALGRVARIEQCRNAPRPYWYPHIKEAKEDEVDWREFLGDLPMRPFDPIQFTAWHGFLDFSDGPIPGLASHFLDLVHSITGATFPKSAVGMETAHGLGDEYQFNGPDHVNASWEYEEGFIVHYSTCSSNRSGNVLKFYGDQGVLDMTDWNQAKVSGEGTWEPSALSKEAVELEGIPTADHVENFLQCVRTRKAPEADIEAGYQHAVACLMAVEACRTGKRQIYDPERREIREG